MPRSITHVRLALPYCFSILAAQSDRHHIAIERRGNTILGKQRNLFGLSSAFIKNLDRLAPRRFLAVVDLSKIQHLPLNHAAVMSAPARRSVITPICSAKDFAGNASITRIAVAAPSGFSGAKADPGRVCNLVCARRIVTRMGRDRGSRLFRDPRG
jgi:hypothetical protein